MPVTMLLDTERKQLLFVMLDFRAFKSCDDCRKLLIEWNSLLAARVLFLKAMHEIKKSVSDIFRVVIKSYYITFQEYFLSPLTN
jgi:hypothetical protein